MDKKAKLDGISIETTFDVTLADGTKMKGLKAKLLFDGITVEQALERWARKSLVIDLQRVIRPLKAETVKKTFVDSTYTVHAAKAGSKIEDPEEKKKELRALLATFSPEELKELLGDDVLTDTDTDK